MTQRPESEQIAVAVLLRLLVEEVVYDKGLLTIKTVLSLEQLHPVSGES